MNQQRRDVNSANSLNRHKIKNVIGRKSVLLSQIEESKIDPTQEPRVTNRSRVNKSSMMNSFNQSHNESFQRRTYNYSTNRGNNTTIGGNTNPEVFRTLLIMVNIDRFIFGYVGACGFGVI